MLNLNAAKYLKYSAVFWFAVLLVGQWLFFYYIMAFYGFSLINDNLEVWNRMAVFGSTPYVVGDFGGNSAFAAHAIGAGIVAFGGALQLIPQIRNRFPRFHRFNGYIYLVTVFLLAISGFYLVWIRGTSPNQMSAIGTSINGLFILTFTYLTLKNAVARNIIAHRKWALRLFLVSNAQWFLRVGVFSYMISGSLLEMNPAFGDPFLVFWTFGCYLMPLAILQLYFYANEQKNRWIKFSIGTVLGVSTILMLIGIIGLTPLLQSLISGAPLSI